MTIPIINRNSSLDKSRDEGRRIRDFDYKLKLFIRILLTNRLP